MSKNVISTEQAPAAIGPYSQAVRTSAGASHLFLSGQIGIDPATGEIAADVEGQTHQVMKNLAAVLQAAGGDLGSLVKTGIFLASMDDFSAVNAIYAGYLSEPYPARATVQVSRLPKDVLVEIDGVAVL